MTLLTSTTPAAALPVSAAPPAAGDYPIAAAPDAGAVAGALPAAALTRFAQLLTLPDAGTAPAANSDAKPAPDAGTDDGAPAAPAAPAADATGAMASMAATMLAVTLPQPSQAGAAASGGDGQPRVDALNGASPLNGASSLNTSAALHGASARLDLSAAGVAVTTVAAPGTAGAMPPAAPPAANSAAAGAAVTAAAQATLPVPAGQQAPAGRAADDAGQATGRVAPAAPAVPAAMFAQSGQTAPAPALAAQAAPLLPSAAPPAPARSADNRRSDTGAADGAVRTALAGAGAGQDDAIAAVSRSDAAPAVVNGSYAPAAPAAPAGDSVKLAGTPEQWQQPLREALGDRLQLQLQRNDEHAVIRLEPPNMGRVEISIRHLGGTLQVNLSANNSEVLRQLNSIGDSVRQDLSQRQFSDVAVTVSAAPRGMLAGGDGRGREQQGQQEPARTPGRALSDDSDAAATFAMSTERE
ncbi:MAG TPA: flagellar hook-length control protein FliK [Burkholderiaceae bacterium]|nr:flagellar hook-length control protein FliK [Burkholderiaceae bacterium]